MTDVDPKDIRDMQATYKAAMIEEYESYVRANRQDDAKEVAAALLMMFGHDVTGGAAKAVRPEPPVERAVPEKLETPEAPETETPVKRGPGRPRKSPPA